MESNSVRATPVYHENENYIVVPNAENTTYMLINKLTSIVEDDDIKMLPAAISVAEQSNAYLLYETWQWIRKQEENNKKVAEDTVSLTDLEIN